ncbi:peptidase M24, structural domain-containing protein [Phycomyces nitens]|nr:peptidase M24, structural domain-containing protein [Phycomyces nitens]
MLSFTRSTRINVQMLSRLMSTQHGQRLTRLRQVMTELPKPLDAFVVPSEDAHQSEYTADCDNRRAWISGFTGSAGCAVITSSDAALFTDGRYFLQASQELGPEWKLMKQGTENVPTWQEYLGKLPVNSNIGIDTSVITAADAKQLERDLASRGSHLVSVSNLVDMVRNDRPKRPSNPVKIHSEKYAGLSHQSKIDQLRIALDARKCQGTVISSLDEIAWLLNLRGSDIHCCPVFFAYCIVTQQEAVLYVMNKGKDNLAKDVVEHLDKAGVQVRDYDDVFEDLKETTGRFMIDTNTTSHSILQALGSERVHEDSSWVSDAKAIKNEAELSGMRNAHKRDAAAVCRHFAWLSKSLAQGKLIREAEAAIHLEDMRKQDQFYVGLAFDTISGTGPNGAIIHYQPPSLNSSIIDPKQIYLCDSGAQYLDGTTDITRTFLFDGQPTDFQKRAFTRVLQAHISIDQAVFPKGTTGYQIDSWARQPLWQDGLDYRHGTGHGVGAYLNVHEGPHGIGSRPVYKKNPLTPGMVVTNEPGYYEDGQFGIRIENVLIVKPKDVPYPSDTPFYGFEHVTFVPMGSSLLDQTLLTRQNQDWLNKYHEECRDVLEPLLKDDPATLEWVEQQTETIKA